MFSQIYPNEKRRSLNEAQHGNVFGTPAQLQVEKKNKKKKDLADASQNGSSASKMV